MTKRDLFVVVADLDAENTIKTLLTRRQESLEIALNFQPYAPPNGDLLRWKERDAGCFGKAADLLRPATNSHRHAIICLDRHGSGVDENSREWIESDIEERLEQNGWARGDAVAIVFDPELEAWAWSDSSHVAETLGWSGGNEELHAYLVEQGLWARNEPKPLDPKSAMERAVREKRVRGGTAPLFAKLGEKVSFNLCEDPAFTKFRETLRNWFPR